MCRYCGVRHANAQPSVPFGACPKPQFGSLLFEVPRPGTFPSGVSGVVGCATVLVNARALGCVSSSFQFGKSMCRARFVFLFDAHKPWCSMFLSASGRASRSNLFFSSQRAVTTHVVDVVWNAAESLSNELSTEDAVASDARFDVSSAVSSGV